MEHCCRQRQPGRAAAALNVRQRAAARRTALVLRVRPRRPPVLLLVHGRLPRLPLQPLGHRLQVRFPGDQR